MAKAAFVPGMGFSNGKLSRFDKYGVTVIRAWPDPRAWRKTRTTPWRCIRPPLDVSLRTGRIVQKYEDYCELAGLADKQHRSVWLSSPLKKAS